MIDNPCSEGGMMCKASASPSPLSQCCQDLLQAPLPSPMPHLNQSPRPKEPVLRENYGAPLSICRLLRATFPRPLGKGVSAPPAPKGSPISSTLGILTSHATSCCPELLGEKTELEKPMSSVAYLAEGGGEGALWRGSVPGLAFLPAAVQLD